RHERRWPPLLENYFGIIEAIFVFSLAIAFYVWQMRDLKKEKLKADARAREAAHQQQREAQRD
ncbi:MAG: hypothetical protein ACRCSX_09375, partial [Allorhizobium sp.]